MLWVDGAAFAPREHRAPGSIMSAIVAAIVPEQGKDTTSDRGKNVTFHATGETATPASPIASAPDRLAGLLEATQRPAPLIEAARNDCDSSRRLPQAVFEAMADTGLFRLWLPRTLGGPELSPFEFMQVVEAASALDGSVGWLVGNGGGMSRVGGYVSKAVARGWFSDRRAFVAAATGAVGTATRVEGGYRLTGRWPFGSGAHHASLFMVLAAEEPDAPRLFCYVGRQDVT